MNKDQVKAEVIGEIEGILEGLQKRVLADRLKIQAVLARLPEDKVEQQRDIGIVNACATADIQEIEEPTLEQRLRAAAFICAQGRAGVGVATKWRFLWPYKDVSDDECLKEAAEFMGIVLTALLQELPPQRIEQISREIGARLFSELGAQ